MPKSSMAALQTMHRLPEPECPGYQHSLIDLPLCRVQEAGMLPGNFLGNHSTWLGFAKDQYGTAADNAQAGYTTASAHAKTGYQKAKATIKDNAPEF